MKKYILLLLIGFSFSCTNTQSELIQKNTEKERKDTKGLIENSSEEIEDEEVEIEQGPVE